MITILPYILSYTSVIIHCSNPSFPPTVPIFLVMQCKPAYSHFSMKETSSDELSGFHGLYRVDLEVSYDSKIQSLGLAIIPAI